PWSVHDAQRRGRGGGGVSDPRDVPGAVALTLGLEDPGPWRDDLWTARQSGRGCRVVKPRRRGLATPNDFPLVNGTQAPVAGPTPAWTSKPSPLGSNPAVSSSATAEDRA